MAALLALTGILLLVSGGVKLRSGHRARLGMQPLTLLELLAGGLWCWAAAAGLGEAGAGIWFVPVGVLLVLGSSVLFWSRMSAYRRQRAETEERRLETYVKYFAGLEDRESDPEP